MFSQIAQDIRTLHDTLCRFKSILVDPAEFACLKAIVLFRSEAKGLKDATQIENLQDQAQVIDTKRRSVNYNPTIMTRPVNPLGDARPALPCAIPSTNCSLWTAAVDAAASETHQLDKNRVHLLP